MITGLPRPLLWTEIKTMDEFLNGDFINVVLYDSFTRLQSRYLSPNLEAVKVFNEVYYQLTRYYYEKQVFLDDPKRLADIKANLGWSYGADLVIIMMYTYIRLKAKPINRIVASKIIKQLKERYSISPFWNEFANITSDIWEWPKTPIDPQIPHPVSAKGLEGRYLDWEQITNNYENDAINEILNLWNNSEDKKEVASLIKVSSTFGAKYSLISRSLTKSLYGVDDVSAIMCSEPSCEYGESVDLNARVAMMLIEKMGLKKRISELEAENEKLKALHEKKKSDGTARKFTLVEIVDYCKSRVEWNDAKDIVTMLNRLLRKIGTDEDSKLVDGIEEEFSNRKYGNTFENAQVTMQKPTINGPINEIHGNDNVTLGGK